MRTMALFREAQMSEITIRSFAHLEDPVERFLAVPRLAEGLTDDQAAAEAAGTRALLDPGNTFYANGEARSFLAERGGRPVGRVTAFENRHLTRAEGPVGLVGLFSCENDSEVAGALITAAAEWLGSRGMRVIRGPMAGDIWHRWRFMTKGFGTRPFPGEPRQPEFYPELFTAAGFYPVRTYCTKLVTDLEAQLEAFRMAENVAAKRGYTFRSFERDRWDEDIRHVYRLCLHSFATTWSVTPTTEEEFVDIYDRWLRRVGPDHIVLAEAEGQVVGLGLALVSPETTINLKTVAVVPEHSGYGLGHAIGAELYRRAIAGGQTRAQHCLMGPATPPQRWDRGRGRVTREYRMYERGIE